MGSEAVLHIGKGSHQTWEETVLDERQSPRWIGVGIGRVGMVFASKAELRVRARHPRLRGLANPRK